MRSKPLRELTADDLARYAWKAISTWGTVEQFKYLLPRLFETVTTSKFRCDTEVLFKKPRLAGVDGWPEAEKAVLNTYCDALWHYALAHHPLTGTLPSFPSIDDCLCSIGQIVDDLSPLLAAWDSIRSTAATFHLIEFASENASSLREIRQLSNAFWKERPTQMQQVVDWFFSHEFALPFDIATQTTTAWELRDDLTKAIQRRLAP